MKTLIMMLLTLGLSLPLMAQGNFGVFGAYWDPDDADSEIGFGAKFKANVTPQWGFELRGSYFEFEERVGTDAKAELDVIPLEFGLVFNFPLEENFTPYIGGGIGYYLMDLEWSGPEGVLAPDVDDEVGFYAVAGAELIFATVVGAFAEVKYTWLEIDSIGGMETTNDSSLDGIGANVGLVVRW